VLSQVDVVLPCTLGDTRDCIDMRDDNHLVTLPATEAHTEPKRRIKMSIFGERCTDMEYAKAPSSFVDA